jgi:hypothetical protein
MKKLYIIGHGEGVYHLIADDGEHLASHFCSSSGYALGDLERNRPERQKEWKKRFGEYEVLYLGQDDMTLEKIKALNREWYKARRAGWKRKDMGFWYADKEKGRYTNILGQMDNRISF